MIEIKTIKRQFFNSLRRGTGEAYLIARDHSHIDFSSYIIKGALHNYAYDGQSENSRGQYIFDLILISSKKEKIRKAVLNGLKTESKETWSLTQLFDIAKLFAQHGDTEARQGMYDRFLNNIINGADWMGAYEILELDCLNGLFFIADKLGKFIEQNPDDWQDDFIVQYFQKSNPRIDAMKELEIASLSNKYIKIYLDNIQQTEIKKLSYVRPLYNLQTLLEKIEKSERPFIGPAYTKNLTAEEINVLANLFLEERNLSRKAKYLSIFRRIQFPYDYKPILELAKRKTISRNRLVEFAVDTLQHFKANEIREFALEKLQHSKRADIYTDLLINNYAEGDAMLLKLIAERSNHAYIIENLAGSYTSIYKANKTPECLEPLVALYNKMNCGIHRNSFIEILVENNVLPDYIYHEIEFDSDKGTREIYRRINQ